MSGVNELLNSYVLDNMTRGITASKIAFPLLDAARKYRQLVRRVYIEALSNKIAGNSPYVSDRFRVTPY